MALDLDKIRKQVDEALANMTPEDIEKYFPKDTTPKGWLSIDDYLPKMLAKDLVQGGTLYKVAYSNGDEGTSIVSDHNMWVVYAREQGVTHWLNE